MSHIWEITVIFPSHTTCPAHLIVLDLITGIIFWWAVQIMKLLIMQVFPVACCFPQLRPHHIYQHPVLEHSHKITNRCLVLQASPSCTSVPLRSHPASSLSWHLSPQTCGCVCSLFTWVCLSCCGLWAGVYHVSWINTVFSKVKTL